MSDLLRDHSQPCGHDWARRIDAQLANSPVFGCSEPGCPGGREVTDSELAARLISAPRQNRGDGRKR